MSWKIFFWKYSLSLKNIHFKISPPLPPPQKKEFSCEQKLKKYIGISLQNIYLFLKF